MTACRKEYLVGTGYLVGIVYLAGIGDLAFMTRNYALRASLVIAWKVKHAEDRARVGVYQHV